MEYLIKNFSRIYQFEEVEMSKILSFARVRRIKRKTFIAEQGDVWRTLAYVKKGLFKAYIIDHEGTNHNIGFYKEDFWISDSHSYNLGQGCLTNIVALEDSEIICFDHQEMEFLFKQIPKFESHFRCMLERRVAALAKDRFNLISLNAEQRYKQFITENEDLSNRITQKEIASYLGIFPESLSRIRRQMANKI